MVGFSGSSIQHSYEKWPMGNDGFVTTVDPIGAIAAIQAYGFDARDVGVLKTANKVPGVTLDTYDGSRIRFTG